MSTITNARRVKDVLEAFRKDTGDLPDLGRDPPVLYSSEHVDHVRGFRHYGKGSLDRISQAVEQRAVRIFQEAIATSGEKCLINDSALRNSELYTLGTE